MAHYVVITILLFTSSFLVTSTEAECGPNEVVKTGIDCQSDCCPEPKHQSSACTDPCVSSCKCQLQYKRALNGTCIPSRECPAIPCGQNEVFESCPVCSEECSNASADGRRCRFIGRVGTTVICQPACRCIPNYWRDDTRNCVYYDQCPQFQTTCE